MRWWHARKGIIEGKIVSDNVDLGDFVDIELSSKMRVGFASIMRGEGFRALHAAPGQVIRTRKSLLEPITDVSTKEGEDDREENL